MLTLLLIAIFFVCFGFLFREGIWSNTIRLINVITAGLLATNFFEPVARSLENSGDWFESCTYVWDFLALWGLFALFLTIFRGTTDFVSKVKVRFRKITEQVGSPLLACCIGWVMICFTTMTLHTAPLARDFLGGSFQPEERMFLKLAPDRRWLAFVQTLSRGTFCRTARADRIRQIRRDHKRQEQWQRWLRQWEQEKQWAFDPLGEFMPKYATRRALLQRHMEKPGASSLRVRPENLRK